LKVKKLLQEDKDIQLVSSEQNNYSYLEDLMAASG